MKYVFVISFNIFLIVNSFAQDKAIDLEQLKAPTAPAANIISIQPNEVVTPKSAKDLEAAILSNYIGEGNSLNVPNNFMLEGMPYWMCNRKNINIIEEYLEAKPGKVIWQNLAFSVASTQNYRIHDTVNTNAFGFGVRTLFTKGKIDDEYKSLIKKIVFNQALLTFQVNLLTYIDRTDPTGITTNQAFFSKLVNNFKAGEIGWLSGLSSEDQSDINIILSDLASQIGGTFENAEAFEVSLTSSLDNFRRNNFKKLVEDYVNFKENRKGIQIEGSSALALNFPTNNLNFSVLPKFGVWFTGTVNLDKDEEKRKHRQVYTNLVFMLRYIRNDYDYYNKYQAASPAFYQSNFDLGTRLDFQANKYSLGFEGISRYRTTLLEQTANPDGTITSTHKSDWEWKYLLNFNYAISPNIVINYNIGKHIEPTIGLNGNIISTIGLNFGFGGPKLEVPTVTK